jgi:hypothetical protein
MSPREDLVWAATYAAVLTRDLPDASEGGRRDGRPGPRQVAEQAAHEADRAVQLLREIRRQ